MDARVVTDRETFSTLASDVGPRTRVPVEVRIDVDDPFDAYCRVRAPGESAFLETGGGRSGWGYFGVDPVERLTVSADATSRRATDGAAAAEFAGSTSPSLTALEALIDGRELHRGPCEVPYPCGVVAWLSYDIARELETVPDTTEDDRGLPRLEACVYDRLVAWEAPREHPTTLRITACPQIEDDPDGAYDRGRERARSLAERIGEGGSDTDEQPGSTGHGPEPSGISFEPGCSREAFADRVHRVKTAIRAGETFQANVSQRLAAPAELDPLALYRSIRRVNPAPYAGAVDFRSVDLLSASPELLLELEGEAIRTEPIAGTRPRGETPAADRALETDLRTDAKERAEHAMLVDLERNDVGAVAEYGSVHVPEYRRVDRYASVMHLVSRVEGRRRADVGLAAAIGAVFPGGTITGAPKPRTMALIDEVEATRRGPYTGSLGIFGFDGRATMNILIRTLVRHEEEYHLRVGAGIVHDSDPDREYQETLDKARGLMDAVDVAVDDAPEGRAQHHDERRPDSQDTPGAVEHGAPGESRE